MNIRNRTMIVALAVMAPLSAAWSQSNTLVLQPQSKLWVEGTSTVQSFKCSARAFDANVATTAPSPVSKVLAGEKAVSTVLLTVPSKQLDCANGTMNEHMLKALKSNEHQTITFRLSSYQLRSAAVGEGSSGDGRVLMTGTLSLGGTEKQITIDAAMEEGANGTLRITGSHELLMSDYGLKPPSLMMGTMKVGNKVKVNFDLYLKG